MNMNIMKEIVKQRPRIHSITNMITANDQANIIHAAGGAPTMAMDVYEVAEMTTQCDALVLNMGAISAFPAMLEAKIGRAHV